MDPWGNLRLLTLNAKTYKFTQLGDCLKLPQFPVKKFKTEAV